jgi:hypothetical protein
MVRIMRPAVALGEPQATTLPICHEQPKRTGLSRAKASGAGNSDDAELVTLFVHDGKSVRQLSGTFSFGKFLGHARGVGHCGLRIRELFFVAGLHLMGVPTPKLEPVKRHLAPELGYLRTVISRVQPRDETAPLPKFNRTSVYIFLGAFEGRFVAGALNIHPSGEMTVFSNGVDPILGHERHPRATARKA